MSWKIYTSSSNNAKVVRWAGFKCGWHRALMFELQGGKYVTIETGVINEYSSYSAALAGIKSLHKVNKSKPVQIYFDWKAFTVTIVLANIIGAAIIENPHYDTVFNNCWHTFDNVRNNIVMQKWKQ